MWGSRSRSRVRPAGDAADETLALAGVDASPGPDETADVGRFFFSPTRRARGPGARRTSPRRDTSPPVPGLAPRVRERRLARRRHLRLQTQLQPPRGGGGGAAGARRRFRRRLRRRLAGASRLFVSPSPSPARRRPRPHPVTTGFGLRVSDPTAPRDEKDEARRTRASDADARPRIRTRSPVSSRPRAPGALRDGARPNGRLLFPSPSRRRASRRRAP